MGITKMYFQNSVIPEEVWTILQERSYCSLEDWTDCSCNMGAKGDKQSQEVCTIPFVDDPFIVKHVVNQSSIVKILVNIARNVKWVTTSLQ